MPPDAKSPQPGKSAPQDDENLPKVKKKNRKHNIHLSSLRMLLSLSPEKHMMIIMASFVRMRYLS